MSCREAKIRRSESSATTSTLHAPFIDSLEACKERGNDAKNFKRIGVAVPEM